MPSERAVSQVKNGSITVLEIAYPAATPTIPHCSPITKPIRLPT